MTTRESSAAPTLLPQRVTLEGSAVRLAPLRARHAVDLYEATHGAGREALWRYLPTEPFADQAAFDASIATKEASEDPLWFAVLDHASGGALGMLSLMRIDAPNRVIEVGGVLFGPAMQRSRASTEAQYLLARYVFETLRYRRYEWKCDNRNEPSQRAALRLGFTFEGVFRQHMIVKGENRDTAWFSMLDGEWPSRKAAFEAWLSDGNFDAQGRQRRMLFRIQQVKS